jgi:predicted MFS family arabinose efflux permease
VFAFATAAAVESSLSTADTDAYGWRIPFVAALFIGLLAYYLHRQLEEPRTEQAPEQKDLEAGEDDDGDTPAARSSTSPVQIPKSKSKWPTILRMVVIFLPAAEMTYTSIAWVQQFEATLAPASYRLNNRPFGDAGAIATTNAAIAAILPVLFFPLAGLAVDRSVWAQGRAPECPCALECLSPR